MRILIVGAGAVGGYFGGRLAQAGRDVTFLVRRKRAAEITAKGLQILSPYGDLTLHPKLITANQIDGPYEAILLGVKSYALSAAMNDIAPAVGAESMIVPLLNGMRHIDLLIARFGAHPVLGGVCLVATEIDSEGRIRQLADFQKLIYGEMDGDTTPRLRKLDEALRDASFDTAISNHIVPDMWQKWVQLASLGALTCLLRGNIGEIAAVPGGVDLARSVLRECSEIARADGYPPSTEFLERHTAALTAADSPTTSSMYRDLKKGEPVEVDSILGDLLARGSKHHLTTPILQAAFVSLSIYQRKMSAVPALK
jgi:2-dehydropantoate 2-reductase